MKKLLSKRILFGCVFFLFSILTFAQGQDVKQTQVFKIVEQMPEFNGAEISVTDASTGESKIVKIEKGATGLFKYLSYTIKYPIEAEECGIQGRVICSFIVEKDGAITEVKVEKSVHPALDKEACRVLGMMPKWKPGKQKGENIRVRYTVPVTFRLQ